MVSRWLLTACLPYKDRHHHPIMFLSIILSCTDLELRSLRLPILHFVSSKRSTRPYIDPACHIRYLDTSSNPAYTRQSSHEQYVSPRWACTNRIGFTLHSRDYHRSPRPYPSFGWGSGRCGPVPASQSRKTSTIRSRVRRRAVDHSKKSLRRPLCRKWLQVSHEATLSCRRRLKLTSIPAIASMLLRSPLPMPPVRQSTVL
jgi:hypothetical protein